MKNKLKYLIPFLIIIILVIFLINNKEKNNLKPTLKKESKDILLYVPSGNANNIDIYYDEVNKAYLTKEKDYDIKNYANYKFVNSYKCDLESCVSFPVDFETNSLVIKDDGYLIYDINKNKAFKINLPNSNYNNVEILSYENKIYGLSVLNINNLYAFYDLNSNSFKSDFTFNNIFINEKAGLKSGVISVVKKENEEEKYYLYDYLNNKSKMESSYYLGSVGNGKYFYYYENKGDDFNNLYTIYNHNLKQVLKGVYNLPGISKFGNIITNESNYFNVYNKKGQLVKKSKHYEQIIGLLNDFVIVLDTDNYVKITDYDGNVLTKLFKSNDNYLLLNNSYWIKKIDGEDVIYVNFAYKKDDNADVSVVSYYFNTNKKQKGLLSNDNL